MQHFMLLAVLIASVCCGVIGSLIGSLVSHHGDIVWYYAQYRLRMAVFEVSQRRSCTRARERDERAALAVSEPIRSIAILYHGHYYRREPHRSDNVGIGSRSLGKNCHRICRHV